MSDPLIRLRSALAGRYRVERQLGEGGMATVYLAYDERHDRRVALKLLKPELAAAFGTNRFLAEIRTTANLQHPGILPLFDSGNATAEDGAAREGDLLFYVMPLVEGESLRQRLDREGPMPVAEAVRIAIAVADALAYAHRQGVIHRDIKPENILLQEGRALVADFGIALAADRVAGERLTRTNIMIGTAPYMGPEQAAGGRVDQRTDVYALGCVTYEMLAGEPPYSGPTTEAVVAKALLGDPRPLRTLRPSVPAHVDAAVRTAIQPRPADRFQDAATLAAALVDRGYRLPGEPVPAAEQRRRWSLGALWVASLLAAFWLGDLVRPGRIGRGVERSVSGSLPVSRFAHVLADDQAFTTRSHSLVAVSPDGSTVVYVANDRLYRRDVAELDAVVIRGSDGRPTSPFFSPDGQFVGYWDAAAAQLRKIPVSGGVPVSLTPATTVYGSTWSADGTIVYGQPDGIWRVPANGGAAERIVAIDPSELAYGPSILPDGKTLLFSLVARASMIGQSTAWDSARVMLHALDTGKRTELGRGSAARYVPTGHLVYAVNEILFAVPFDAAKSERRGEAVPIVEGVQRAIRGSGGQAGGANYDFGLEGTLVYVPAQSWAESSVPRRLVAVDRQGNAEPLLEDERDYWRPRISPDGTRVAVEVLRVDQLTEIWIVDLDRRTAIPLTGGADSAYPVWTPDSRSVVYWSTRAGSRGMYRQPADGTGDAARLPGDGRAEDISRDGWVAITGGPRGARNWEGIRTLLLGPDSIVQFLTSSATIWMARFSPDGKWVAYTSDETGRNEVYVRPYPREPGVARLVSVAGGSAPVWAPDGSELYYQGASGYLMAVPTTTTGSFTTGRAEPLFKYAGRFRMSGTATAYDIHPDGRRFIMVAEPDSVPGQSRQVNVVRNWFQELTARVR